MLSSATLVAALDFVGDAADASDDAEAFARCGVEGLSALLASELTTLSVCDLHSARRPFTGTDAARARFERHFNQRPLVQHHARDDGRHAHRVIDPVASRALRASAPDDEHGRQIGLGHTVALPLYADQGWLVSFVLNRKACDFTDDELALLELVRRPLARLFRRSAALARPHAEPASLPANLPLTARERDVLRWVAAGKTDRDIAEILSISPRTVHKHLQRVYAKLGVETRTAAVMRALAS
jgi:DNA-binding CsgD family transcriptional regulator